MYLDVLKGIAIFLIGILVSQFVTPLPSFELPLGTSSTPIELSSPKDWIPEKDIEVYNDKIVIHIDNPMWAKFTDTNSMDPILDIGSNGIQIKPKLHELEVGDIVSYRPKGKDYVIIHRIVDIKYDEKGWYCNTKGDNASKADTEKIRFNQIERVLVGIIY